MQTSRIARLAGSLGIVAVVLFVGAPAGIQIGLLESFLGFRIFLLGALLGLVALLCGLLGLFFTRASARRAGRGRAALGAVLGALVVAAIAFMGRQGRGVPPINDITTNPDDPPVFVIALEDPANRDRDMGYPGASFAAQQRAGYPDLAPIAVALPPAEAFERTSALFERFGWHITRSDPQSGALEATDTSRLFHFVDDIVVRVRPQDGGSVVDVRSKSRVGRGDLGANAARIRRLRAGLGGAASR